MYKRMIWAGLLLIIWVTTAHAQVGVCPAGTIPNGTQTSAMECAPDPDYQAEQQPAPPPPVWVDRWGAVADADDPPSAFGASTDMPSEASAKNLALLNCEATPGAHCRILLAYRSQCVAVTAGDKIPAIVYGAPTVQEAKRLSMNRCTADGNHECIPYYSACSYPVRIQ